MSDFAKNLRILRRARGVSQLKLGHVLNYGYTAITNYESGRNEPSLDDLIRLAEFFDVSVDELLGTERFYKNQSAYDFFCSMDEEKREKVLQVMRIFD